MVRTARHRTVSNTEDKVEVTKKIHIVYKQDPTADEGYVREKVFKNKKKAEAYVAQQQQEHGFAYNPWYIETVTVVE